jgi:enoyl-CoA hydratase
MDINLSVSDHVALITLDDGKKNAVNIDALAGINAALDEADEKAKAVVIAGRPGSFCAGFDLATMTGGDMDAIVALGTQGGLLATAAGLAALPAKAYAGNKLIPRAMALDIMRNDLQS